MQKNVPTDTLVRGIGNYLLARQNDHPNPRDIHFYSSSGGNAGLACVTAARQLARPATVVVPHSTKPFMIAKLQAAGAHDVIQHGNNWKEADTHLREVILQEDPNGVYVPPFDHKDVWAGHATMVEEIKKQMGGDTPDAISVSVGGGGLLNGVVQGLHEAGWDHTTVLAMETQGAHSLRASLNAGELVTLPGITSQASSLGAVRVAAKTFENGRLPNVKSVVLSDAEAALGCWRLADDERIMVELACGVNVALCYDGRLQQTLDRPLTRDFKLVIVVCGGNSVSIDILAGWRKEFGYIEKKIPHPTDVPSAQTAPAMNGNHTNGHNCPQPEDCMCLPENDMNS